MIAIGPISYSLEINGISYSIRNEEDIKKLSQDEMTLVCNYLMLYERPKLLVEASKVPELEKTVAKLEKEKNNLNNEKEFYFMKAQSIEDLTNKMVQYHNENMALKEELMKLEADFKSLTETLNNVVQPISARQIANDAEADAIKYIFPDARKKPFCIRSLGNLLSFINNPESDEFTSPHGPSAWKALGKEKTDSIKDKANELINKHPYLKVSIKHLKDSAWKQAHSTTTIKETIEFYMEKDEELVDCISECIIFSESFKAPTTSIDVDKMSLSSNFDSI